MHAINWFEIPAADLDRAARFYSAVLGQELRRDVFFGVPHAFFPRADKGVGGALIRDEKTKPSASGTLVYLNAGTEQELDLWLSRVEKAGGTVAVPKTSIGPQGVLAILVDTEGNRTGLHAPV